MLEALAGETGIRPPGRHLHQPGELAKGVDRKLPLQIRVASAGDMASAGTRTVAATSQPGRRRRGYPFMMDAAHRRTRSEWFIAISSFLEGADACRRLGRLARQCCHRSRERSVSR